MSATSERFARINAMPAYQQVAEAIERKIVGGGIRPGEPIGTEAELVRQFGVNRSTVREGIRLLEQGGLIRRSSDRRLLASLPRHQRLASRISRALVLHEVTFRELFEAMMAMEIATIEQAVDHATADDIAALEANLERTIAAAGKPAALAELDTEFHTLLANASHNRVLQLAREPSGLLIYPTTEIIFEKIRESQPRLVAAHRCLIESLRTRDKEMARTWMRRHVNDWRKGFERAGKELDRPIERVYAEHLMVTGGERR